MTSVPPSSSSGTIFHEHLGHFLLTFDGRKDQGGIAVVTPGVDLGPVFKQDRGAFHLRIFHGTGQGGIAEVLLGFDAGTLGKQFLDDRGIAPAGGLDHLVIRVLSERKVIW